VPVLADIQIDYGDLGVYDAYPTPLPDLFVGTAPSIHALRRLLGAESALVALRAISAAHLAALSRPLGLRPPQGAGGGRKAAHQQRKGPDPPGGRA
jgi:hypothetical protein